MSYESAKREVARDIEQCIQNREQQKKLEKEKEKLTSPKEKFNEEFKKLKNG